MKTKATLQMVAIAKRIAAKNGVSVDEVLDRFNQDVEKTSFAKNDLFLGDSVITLDNKKSRRSDRGRGLPSRYRGVR